MNSEQQISHQYFFLRNEVFNCIHFWEIFLLHLNSMALCYNPEEELENRKFFCEKKEFSIFFWTLTEKNRPFAESFSAGASKLFLLVQRNILRKMYTFEKFKNILTTLSLSEPERKICGLLTTFFWQGCQRCILRVHRDCLRKMNFSEKKRFFETFRYWMKNFWPFVERLSAGLSKLDSTFSKKHFEEN